MAGRLLFISVLVLCACASRQQLPPGDELEASRDTIEKSTVNESKMPAQSQELETAFEPPAPPAPKPVDPSADPPNDPIVDASAAERDEVQQKLKDCKQLIVTARLDEARDALDAMGDEAQKVGPAESQQLFEMQVKVALAQKEWRIARKAAESWLTACGPDRVEWCRSKAIAALNKIGAQQKTPEAAAAKAKAANVRAADDCLAKAESSGRAKAAMPGCLDGAIGTYRAMGDKLQQQRAKVAQAQAAAGDPTKREHAQQLFAHAAQLCQEQRCVTVRRRARKMEGWLWLEAGDSTSAAKAMLEEMRLGGTTMPVEKRRYARTTEVDKVCATVDAKEGAGTCRKLEKTVVGEYTFKDFSAQKARQGLEPKTVRTVNEHFAVMLQDCLSAEAERLKPPAYETYEVRWMVRNDGHVEQVHLGKDYQESTPLALCLRQAFSVWRYPRYDGEAQHVEQSFTVSARERR